MSVPSVEKASITERQWMREGVAKDNGKDIGRRHIMKGSVKDNKKPGFYSKCNGKPLDDFKQRS